MANFRVQFNELGNYEAALGKAFKPAVSKALKKAARNTVDLYKYGTRNAPPASPNGSTGAVASGRFLRSWKVQPTSDQYTVHVFNEADHAYNVEEGRKAGSAMPPVSEIAAWVLKKGLGKKQGRDKRGRFMSKNVRAIAFLIARAIARRGLKGRHIVKTYENSARTRANQLLRDGLDEAMKKARKA